MFVAYVGTWGAAGVLSGAVTACGALGGAWAKVAAPATVPMFAGFIGTPCVADELATVAAGAPVNILSYLHLVQTHKVQRTHLARPGLLPGTSATAHVDYVVCKDLRRPALDLTWLLEPDF